MANTKSAKKRIRQTVTRTERNRRLKSMVKTSVRRFEESLQNDDRDSLQTRLLAALRQIDKAVAKGVIHKNTAARKKSRLTRLFNQKEAV